ncbi:MAG TPA: helix-turn-helix domain-containing protein [Syntrophales bacterium]|nr:helix-turn-helix domain-containing protein [Syntrophales bacterium]
MKPYREQNYYELLEIPPDASPLEIRRAYKRIFDLYQDESIASYSFFSKEERRNILSLLEKAYLVLIDIESRARYDQKLIELGLLLKEKQYMSKMKEPIPMYDFKKVHFDVSEPVRRPEELRTRVSQSSVIKEILSHDTLCGADLARIRKELEIPLEEIADNTKVQVGVLRAIEEDNIEMFPPAVYLRGFLKSYARYLQLDENVLVNGFMKHTGT